MIDMEFLVEWASLKGRVSHTVVLASSITAAQELAESFAARSGGKWRIVRVVPAGERRGV